MVVLASLVLRLCEHGASERASEFYLMKGEMGKIPVQIVQFSTIGHSIRLTLGIGELICFNTVLLL